MSIKEIFTSVSVSLLLDIVLAFFMGIVLFHFNHRLFFILIIMVCINIILVYLFKKPYKKLNYEQMESGAMLNSHLIESIQNIETVKAQNDEKQQLEKLEQRFISLLKINFREGTLSNIQSVIANFVQSIGGLIFMGIGGLLIIDGKMSIGDLLVFQSLSQYFTEPVQNLVSMQLTFQEANVAMTRLKELMSLTREDEQSQQTITNIDWQGDIH